jgi:hypothetical protein
MAGLDRSGASEGGRDVLMGRDPSQRAYSCQRLSSSHSNVFAGANMDRFHSGDPLFFGRAVA